METMKIAGRDYPVLGIVTVNGQSAPLVNIRMMSEERERELARNGSAS